MYYLEVKEEISSAHYLTEPYEGKCNNIHGHNWKVKIYCKSERLNECGMVVDFKEIKEIIKLLDHRLLNELIPQPTAENIAHYLTDSIANCYKVEITESEGNKAIYEI